MVEFKAKGGAKFAYDKAHADMDASKGHDNPHIGWQSRGKRLYGRFRDNITNLGPQHPSRTDKTP